MLRAKTAEAIGKLGFAAGRAKYQPYLESFSQRVLADLQKWELFEMSEAAYSYFGDMAKLLGSDFAPMLATLVPLAIKSCMSEEGIKKEYEEKKKEDFSFGSDSEDDDANLKGVTVRTAFIDEKTTALHALGLFSISCPKAFLQYMPNCIQMLETIWNYFNETVRYQVVQTYQQFVEGINLAFYGTESHPKPICGLPPKQKLAPDAHKFYFETVLPRFLHLLKTDEDRDVVAKVLEAISDLCHVIGSAVIDHKLGEIIEAVMPLLLHKAPCQTEEDDNSGEEEEGSEDDIDHDELLLTNLFELLQDIAKACGESITSQYKPIFEILLKYLKSPHPESDWIAANGCFAELFKALPSKIGEYYKKILPQCCTHCSSGKNDLTRNCAYCIGIITEYAKDSVIPYIPDILQALKNAYEMPKAAEPKDNAISSLLRLLVAHPDKIPLTLVLPAIFEHIPLCGDLEENINIVRSLIMLPPECK